MRKLNIYLKMSNFLHKDQIKMSVVLQQRNSLKEIENYSKYTN